MSEDVVKISASQVAKLREGLRLVICHLESQPPDINLALKVARFACGLPAFMMEAGSNERR
jgi:hypothetical protein